MAENEYVVTGQIFAIVTAETAEDAKTKSRNKNSWEDWDWYEQDAELYEERSDL